MVACYRLPLLFMVLAVPARGATPLRLAYDLGCLARGTGAPVAPYVALTTLFCPNAELASGQ